MEGLDVARGVAVFGILVVNAQQMAQPLALMAEPVTLVDGSRGLLTQGVWALTHLLFELRFVTLFSLLFGIGFALQHARTEGEGRGLALRRLAVLGLFGLVHAILLFEGDVLLVYAVFGLLLFPAARASTRSLERLTCGLLLAVVLIHLGLRLGHPHTLERAEARRQAVTRILELSPDRVDLGGVSVPRPLTPAAVEAVGGRSDGADALVVEYLAATEGSFALHLRIRFGSWLDGALVTAVFLGWRTLAFFLLGMLVVRWGWLEGDRRALWRSIAAWGLGIGLALGAASTAVSLWVPLGIGALHDAAGLAHDLAAMALAPAYVALSMLWPGTDVLPGLRVACAATGRMALTHYLGQSLAMGWVMGSWGLGLYGRLYPWQILAVAVVLFGGQVAFSFWWLRRFRFGPVEWLWRCASYGRRLPLFRTVE
ncbi:MAG: DUF418 domain-containing protein [Acidobacteriota bacterium]